MPYKIEKMWKNQGVMRDKGSSSVLFIILLVGVLLRVVASLGDYWLDEVISIVAVSELQSPFDIFTQLFTDNNHLLNSLQIYFFHSLGSESFYRVLPTLASIAVLIMVWDMLADKPIAEQVLGLSFFSFSYVLILLSTEARGYSFLLFASIALFSLFESTQGRLSFFHKLFFWFISILGVLAHYTFLQFYVALLCFHLLLVVRKKTSFWSLFNHIVPLSAFAGLYFVHMRHLSDGSGPLRSQIEVLINTLSISFGGIELGAHMPPQYGLCIFLFATCMALLLFGGVVSQLRRGSDDWIFYLMVIFVCPALGILYFEPRVVFVRYFLLSIAFSYFLLAKVVMRLQKRAIGVLVSLGVFGFFLLGNIYNTSFLLLFQRGKYQEAMNHMSQESEKRTLPKTVSSDHDWRNFTLIDYYSKRNEELPKLNYVANVPNAEASEWYLVHELSQRREARREMEAFGEGYTLEKTYLHSPLSGWSWFVYKRKEYRVPVSQEQEDLAVTAPQEMLQQSSQQ